MMPLLQGLLDKIFTRFPGGSKDRQFHFSNLINYSFCFDRLSMSLIVFQNYFLPAQELLVS
jgi:hypothetical protein